MALTRIKLNQIQQALEGDVSFANNVTISGNSHVVGTLTVDGTVNFSSSNSAGTFTFGDGDKLQFGDSQDLEILHTGTYSAIQDKGEGALFLGADDFVDIGNSGLSSSRARFYDNTVRLYANNQIMLATSTTGVDITNRINVNNSSQSGYAIVAKGTSTGYGLHLQSDSANESTFFANSIIHGGDLNAASLLNLRSDNSVANSGRSQLQITGNTNQGQHRFGIGIDTSNEIAYLATQTKANTAISLPLEFRVGNVTGLDIDENINVNVSRKLNVTGETTLNSFLKIDHLNPRIDFTGDDTIIYRIAVDETTNKLTLGHSSNRALFLGNDGNASFAYDLAVDRNLTVAGDFTVSGNTTFVNTDNLSVEDAVITLAAGATTPVNDIGILYNRYGDNANSTNYNVFTGWDEPSSGYLISSTTNGPLTQDANNFIDWVGTSVANSTPHFFFGLDNANFYLQGGDPDIRQNMMSRADGTFAASLLQHQYQVDGDDRFEISVHRGTGAVRINTDLGDLADTGNTLPVIHFQAGQAVAGDAFNQLWLAGDKQSVGINTSIPTNNLQIGNSGHSGYALATATDSYGAVIQVGSTTTANPANAVLWVRNLNDSTDANTSPSELFRVNAGGNVGIGLNAPEGRLHITGGSYANNLVGPTDLVISSTDSTGTGIRMTNHTGKNWFMYNGGTGAWVGDGGLGFVYNDGTSAASAPKLMIAPDGNVGIGAFAGTNPSERLHVIGPAIAIDSNSANNPASLKFINDNERSRITSTYGPGGGGVLSFYTDTTGGSLINRLTLGNDGSVEIPSNGWLSTRAIDSLYYGRKSFRTPYFTNGVSYQAVDIELGNTYINSYIRVSINDGFSNQNVSGLLQREWVVGFNPNGSMWQPPLGRTPRAFGPIAGVFAISDPFWDSSDSQYKIRIHHTGTLGNNITATIEGWGPSAGTWIKNSSVGSLLTGITPPTTQKEHIPGPIGIGDINQGAGQPQKPLEVVVDNNDFASVGVRQMSPGNWSGIHFGYRESNNFYRKSAIVFERTDLTENNAQGKVHLLNGPQSGAGSATLSDARLTIAEQGRIGILGVQSPNYSFEMGNGETGRAGAMKISAALNSSGKGLVIDATTRTINDNNVNMLELVNRAGVEAFSVTVAGQAAFSSNVSIGGSLTASSKSFDIEHPTKEGMRLHHGSLEGPEHGVYVRGRLKDNNTIELPDYWVGLVHEDTITVQLTAIGGKQDLWVEDIDNNTITVGSSTGINCFYLVQAERKDVDRFDVEYVDAD